MSWLTAPGHLLVSDLDGTLLRSDTSLSDAARDGLNALVAAGVVVTVASARSTAAMRPMLPGVDLRLPVIEHNGAYISDLRTGEHLVTNALDAAIAGKAVELLGDPIVTSWDGTRDRVHHGTDLNTGAGWFIAEKRRYADPRLTETADLRAVAGQEQVVMLCSYVPDEDASSVAAAVQDAVGEGARVWAALNYYSPGWSEVVVQSPLATKGAAILELRQRLGLAGEITVCGDHLNDLPMFAVADRRVAPANAQPEVRAAASVVTGANDDDGVVTYLLEQLAIRRREADE
ncbi:HAD hydrolase family protein [Kutzneria sp. CA-103260]|uniref:HAD hydrolase family protein n=1 Tax=Kutzneria sp. CA-103260 TaxID=2802641 RepID=UPI001BA5E5AB|nr:HAD family hydrolase [Kutzneria sp. CA-103260]